MRNRTVTVGWIDGVIYFLTILAAATPPDTLPPNWKYGLTLAGALAGAVLTVMKGNVTKDAEEAKEDIRKVKQEVLQPEDPQI